MDSSSNSKKKPASGTKRKRGGLDEKKSEDSSSSSTSTSSSSDVKRFKRMGNPLILLQVDNIRPLACLPKDFGSTVRFVMETDVNEGRGTGIRCNYSDSSNTKILCAFFKCDVMVSSTATAQELNSIYTIPCPPTPNVTAEESASTEACSKKKNYCIKIDTSTFRDVIKNFVHRNYSLRAGVFADSLSMVFRNVNESNHYKFDMSLLVDTPSEEDIPIDLSSFTFDFVSQLSTKMLMVILDMLKKLCSQLFVEICILRGLDSRKRIHEYIRFCSKDTSKTEMKGMTAYYRCQINTYAPEKQHAPLAQLFSAEPTAPRVINVVSLKSDSSEIYNKEFAVEDYENEDEDSSSSDEYETDIIDDTKFTILYCEQYPVDAIINFLSDVHGDTKVLLFMLKAMPLVIQSMNDDSASWARLCLAPRTLEGDETN